MLLGLPLRTNLVIRITGKSAGNNSSLIISIEFRRERERESVEIFFTLRYGYNITFP